MAEWDALCPGCFADKGNMDVCPNCGYDESERRTPLVLPYRVVLNGQFIVGKVLGKPGALGSLIWVGTSIWQHWWRSRSICRATTPAAMRTMPR